MKVDLFFRVIVALILGIFGWEVGMEAAGATALTSESLRWVAPLTLAGIVAGAVLAPWLTTVPARWARRTVRQIPAQQILAAAIGLGVGLLIAALLAWPLSFLPSPFGKILPAIGAVVLGYLGTIVMVLRQKEIFALLGARWSAPPAIQEQTPVLLDTSVIIDGRIADICQTGFIRGPMIVPRFVLNELQHIADSPDPLRRNRGRRGLDMLNKMQHESEVPVVISDLDVDGVRQVDDKLVQLGKQLGCPVVTNDFNLNQVAGLQGVTVLNINALANAVKSVVLPGETMRVRIIQEGKENSQGVGYLDDGTMVVVENGYRYMNNVLDVVVTKVLQTNAGRMLFAQPHSN